MLQSSRMVNLVQFAATFQRELASDFRGIGQGAGAHWGTPNNIGGRGAQEEIARLMAENADLKTGVRHGGGAPSTPPQSQSSGAAVAGARVLRSASAGGLRRNSGRSASQVLHG